MESYTVYYFPLCDSKTAETSQRCKLNRIANLNFTSRASCIPETSIGKITPFSFPLLHFQRSDSPDLHKCPLV